MKCAMVLAVIAAGLGTVPAFAGEGEGHPFEYINPGITATVDGHIRQPARGSDPFPFRVMDRLVAMGPFALIPSQQSEGIVQTENALPVALGTRSRLAALRMGDHG